MLAELALLDLFYGRIDAAVSRLTSATTSAPKAAAVWNELAVVRLERSQSRKDPYDSVLALEACETALAIDPDLLPARFNYALITEELALRTASAAAWNDYLTRDPSSHWATEARSHRSRLLETSATIQACKLGRFDDALRRNDAAALNGLIASCPLEARSFASEVLLAAWANDATAGHQAAATIALGAARHAGAVAERLGDLMLADSTAAAAAARGSLASLRALDAGFTAYREGLGALRERRPRTGARALSVAQGKLRLARNPLAVAAAFEHAVSTYYLADYATARDELLRLVHWIPPGRYPVLDGNIAWILGLTFILEADPGTALAYYQRGIESCRHGGDVECVGALHSLIAESLSLVGDEKLAWEHRQAALAAAVGLPDSTRLQTIYDEAAEAALRENAPRAARLLQDEAIAVATRLGDPLALCDGLLRRIPIDRQLEDFAAVEADRASAEHHAQRILDQVLRQRSKGELAEAYADARASDRPVAAATSYTRAIEIFAEIDYRYPLVRLLAARSAAWERLGDLTRAESDLEAGLREVDHRRGELQTREQRLGFLERSRALFDAMLSFASRRLHDAAEAFRYAELGRSRSLLDASASHFPSTMAHPASGDLFRPMTLASVARGLPPGDALLEFAVLEDHLLRWSIRRESVDFSEVNIGSGALAAKVKTLLAALEKPAGEPGNELAPVARELYRLLIPPGLAGAAGMHRLVIVPDRQLNALPFAALIDPGQRRFLIEQVEIVVAPSASFYLQAPLRPPQESLPDSALIVGDPYRSPDSLPRLRPLPGAREEALALAAVYPRSRVLIGEQATKPEFLKAAGGFQVIHFAGHAVSAGNNPLLFLASGNSNSGVLAGAEIEELALTRTRLVVLAACRSGAGEILETEGARSAARAFLIAGAPAVVASLFNLDDREVERLVSHLHQRVARGENPATALRAAQLQSLVEGAVSGSGGQFGWASLQLIGKASPRKEG